MDEICGFKFHLSCVDCRYDTIIILEIPPCAFHVIFITEFVLLIKIPPFFEVNSFVCTYMYVSLLRSYHIIKLYWVVELQVT